jgi:hypothetical protein
MQDLFDRFFWEILLLNIGFLGNERTRKKQQQENI